MNVLRIIQTLGIKPAGYVIAPGHRFGKGLLECLRIKLTESMGGALSSGKKAHLLEASAVRGVPTMDSASKAEQERG